jgi:Tol biopolymer transport system component
MEGVGHLPDLYAMRRDGSDVTPLTRTKTWESTPDWSPGD